jgi:hypothetical protein
LSPQLDHHEFIPTFRPSHRGLVQEAVRGIIIIGTAVIRLQRANA